MFSDWLNEQLKEKDWQQADLARASGLTTAAISKYMAGRIPDKNSLKKLAKAFDLPADLVFEEAGVLPKGKPANKILKQIQYFLENVPESERINILEFARHRFELEQREKNGPKQSGKKPVAAKQGKPL